MRPFALKENQSKKATVSPLKRPYAVVQELHHRGDHDLHLPRTIGNQAMQRMLQTHVDEFNTKGVQVGNSDRAAAPPIVNEVLAAPSQALDNTTSGCASKSPAHPSWLRSQLAQWSEHSIESLWQSTKPVPTPSFVKDVVRYPGEPLENVDRGVMETRFNYDFGKVRIHTDTQAALSAERLGAAAYSAGSHVVFARGQYAAGTQSGRRLLTHELTHMVQRYRKLPAEEQGSAPDLMVHDAAAEQEADAWAAGKSGTAGPVVAAPSAVLPSIAEKILKFAAKQLEKRTIRTVSKHIARHARQIAGRAIHSIFKNPREIRYVLQRMVREATEIAAKHPSAGTQQVIEEAGIRITRQATGTPGKFRLLIQKVFDREIGTRGERVLRLVLDQTGRIVTAFPADRLATIGLTVAGIEALTAGTARAGETVQDQAARVEAAEKAREERVDIWEWVPFIGDIWGGSLNEGEDEMLRQEREVAALIRDAIDDVEKAEQRSLGEPEREYLAELIRAAIASPLVMEDPDPG